MKILAIWTALVCLLNISNSFAAFTLNDPIDTEVKFSENQYGLGLSIAKEFKIEDNIFTEDGKDHLFNEIAIFANHYGDVIDKNYGAGYSFGYGYGDFASYLTGGYVITDFEYTLDGVTKDYSEGAGFVGIGISYKLTSYLKTKLDFMNYQFDFVEKTSILSQKTEISIRSLNLGLQFYF